MPVKVVVVASAVLLPRVCDTRKTVSIIFVEFCCWCQVTSNCNSFLAYRFHIFRTVAINFKRFPQFYLEFLWDTRKTVSIIFAEFCCWCQVTPNCNSFLAYRFHIFRTVAINFKRFPQFYLEFLIKKKNPLFLKISEKLDGKIIAKKLKLLWR